MNVRNSQGCSDIRILGHLETCGHSIKQMPEQGDSVYGGQSEFNTSFPAEIENGNRFLPLGFAKNSPRFCETGLFALRYGPYRDAKRPILRCEETLFGGRKRLFWGRKGWFRGLKKLHNWACKTCKSYETNGLRLHTHISRICGGGQIIFKFANFERVKQPGF